jgi:lysophospholipase L1-like esterase
MGRERGVPVFFVDEVAASSPVDGIHLAPSAHTAIGRAMAKEVRSILEKKITR